MSFGKIILSIILMAVGFFFANCVTNLTNKEVKGIYNNFIVVEYNPEKHHYFFENAKQTQLNTQEIERIYKITEKKIAEYNNKNKEDQINNLSEYKFQLLPVINKEDKKEIYVNAFCDADKEFADEEILKLWQREIRIAHDGGNCFFHLYINLTQNTIRGFYVNYEIDGK